MTDHHIFRSKDEESIGSYPNEWFHCGACPCEDPDETAYTPKDHETCKTVDSDTLSAMIHLGMFGEDYQPEEKWW